MDEQKRDDGSKVNSVVSDPGNGRLTRRKLLTAGAALPLATAAAATTIRGEMPWREGEAAAPNTATAAADANANTAYAYFSPAEAAFIEAAVARLIPQDDLGPGAVQAGVP